MLSTEDWNQVGCRVSTACAGVRHDQHYISSSRVLFLDCTLGCAASYALSSSDIQLGSTPVLGWQGGGPSHCINVLQASRAW